MYFVYIRDLNRSDRVSGRLRCYFSFFFSVTRPWWNGFTNLCILAIIAALKIHVMYFVYNIVSFRVNKGDPGFKCVILVCGIHGIPGRWCSSPEETLHWVYHVVYTVNYRIWGNAGQYLCILAIIAALKIHVMYFVYNIVSFRDHVVYTVNYRGRHPTQTRLSALEPWVTFVYSEASSKDTCNVLRIQYS
jgi:hypothetical protein